MEEPKAGARTLLYFSIPSLSVGRNKLQDTIFSIIPEKKCQNIMASSWRSFMGCSCPDAGGDCQKAAWGVSRAAGQWTQLVPDSSKAATAGFSWAPLPWRQCLRESICSERAKHSLWAMNETVRNSPSHPEARAGAEEQELWAEAPCRAPERQGCSRATAQGRSVKRSQHGLTPQPSLFCL